MNFSDQMFLSSTCWICLHNERDVQYWVYICIWDCYVIK